MNICLLSREEIDAGLDLRDERAKHILSVLHKGEGDCFSAGIIGGKAGQARIETIAVQELTAANGKHYRGGRLTFSFQPESDGKPLYPLIMLIGFPRPIQLKRLLRDMAGLGVCSVYLCGTELGEKSYLKSTLADEAACRKMLVEGTVQAASTHVPRVKVCPDLPEALSEARQEARGFQAVMKYAMDNVRPEESLASRLERERSVLLGPGCGAISAIGSERGWTDRERDLLEQDGFSLLGMGTRVLRTESAATVSASLILAAMGKL